MFSIFSHIMSRVTHSEPGLPMLLVVHIYLKKTHSIQSINANYITLFETQKLWYSTYQHLCTCLFNRSLSIHFSPSPKLKLTKYEIVTQTELKKRTFINGLKLDHTRMRSSLQSFFYRKI